MKANDWLRLFALRIDEEYGKECYEFCRAKGWQGQDCEEEWTSLLKRILRGRNTYYF